MIELADALAGPGVTFEARPREGKIQLIAAYDGLLKVQVDPLTDFNLISDVMCASIHNNMPVKKGHRLAGTRAIPLVIERNILDQAVSLATASFPIFAVKAFNPVSARLIITGNEIYEGLIEDRFEAIIARKLAAYGSTLAETVILPDDQDQISSTVQRFFEMGTDLIITTGGMSVDPDDVTRLGIRGAGVDQVHYGAAVLPGAMFLLAYKGDTPIVGIPACGLYHPTTIFDLILPRLLAGEQPNARAGFMNISLRTTRAHLSRAIMEGLAFNNRWTREPAEKLMGRKMENIRFSGVGALSDLWAQIHADVLGLPVHQVEDPVNATVRGTALLVLETLGYCSLEDISGIVKIKKVFEPDGSKQEIYDKMYTQYRELFKRNKPVFTALNG